MSRVLPMPWISLGLLLTWPLLLGDLTPLVGLGAAVFALALPLLVRAMQPAARRAGRPLTIIHLSMIVLWDIIKSNLIVARIVLGPLQGLTPLFVEVPVETDHPLVLNLLASIITMTPGTVSANVDAGAPGTRPRILVHALSCDDGPALIADIKSRYEGPLLEIFGCSNSR